MGNVEQIYTSCCIRLLKNVTPMSTAKEGCAHSLIVNDSVGKPPVSNGPNDISCCESGTAKTPPVCNEVNDISVAVSNKRRKGRSCSNLADEPVLVCDEVNDISVAVSNKRRKERPCSNLSDEPVLVLVARHTNWNPLLLCFLSCICKKMNAICNRIPWRNFCLSRAPKMASDLLLGAKEGRIDGGWQSLGKLFLYCAGCCHSNKSSHLVVPTIAGHFVPRTRFSRTSGHFFLLPRCRTDVLYMSDPCEHANNPEDVGVFRGVFKGFDKSKTKKCITSMRVQLEEEEKCPFCKASVWSMGKAHMIPRSASSRLGAYNDNVEYFICLNGHVNGRCTLLHLSDTDDSDALH